MNDDQLAVLERLQAFSLDEPGASFPFSKKLARENHWKLGYARRVIEEYKRFCFLAVVSGHPVSPSEDVDQVWHMHLTYSQNYWKVFCPEVLGRPFHHHPSQGGQAESQKFEDWYARTLDSYRTFFGSEAPSDIWPSPEDRKKLNPEFVRVDKREHWVLRKPRFTAKGRIGLVALLSLFVAGCSGAVAGANPFDWNGPTFLQFYLALYPVCLAIALGFRSFLRQPAPPVNAPQVHLNGYQMAYLNGGAVLAIQTAVASLARQGYLATTPTKRLLQPTGLTYQGVGGFEQYVYDHANVPSGVTLGMLYYQCKSGAEMLGEELKSLGLLVPDSLTPTMIGVPLMIAMLAPVIGVIKIFVGISRDRPVGILIGFCFASVLISCAVLARRANRSRYGDVVLGQFRARYGHMQHLGHHQSTINNDELLVAMGLFGVGCLAGSSMGDLAQTLRAPVATTSTSGGGCGSSCGGGGGGDGGGGGGGCGGGGCGGCGG